MCASYYRHAPPPSATDPYSYSTTSSSSSHALYSTTPPPPLPPPSQPYSHPHNPHSYHIQHPPLDPAPTVVTFSYALPAPLPPPPPQNQLRTLFVAGLPDDTKPREVYNLFREFPGYESSSLRVNRGSAQAYAFAVFSDQQSAMTALHNLNGMKFDLERDSTLHIELAKSNSRGKRTRDDDSSFPSHGPKYSKVEEDFGAGSNMHTSGHALHSLSGYSSSPRFSSLEPPPPGTDYRKPELRSTGVPQENPPCPTLYVADLGPTCTEDELNQVFSRWPGFLKLKLQRRHGPSAAFVDFSDEESATAALINLQGTFLHSSSERMRIEYPYIYFYCLFINLSFSVVYLVRMLFCFN
ncbi:RNA-binding (RRM/RBD/RNP motifs) family protein [Rhynchospora pubera]|uniref:RNA-binding (RRM/RBD/RNP motifs) family protein n=1 Tax=Rhynchospora pubera TaxID=906938 RepID=A0AAV8FNX9_9POAL|nr:RNA-binding (RRM/RBD/RNP motifs) family protein [Rhynchospora pubera]